MLSASTPSHRRRSRMKTTTAATTDHNTDCVVAVPPSTAIAAITTATTTTTTSTPTTMALATGTRTEVLRGTIVRKRKYHKHISYAIRPQPQQRRPGRGRGGVIVAPQPEPDASPVLIMVPRHDPAISLVGIFLGTVIEVEVDVVVGMEVEATVEVEEVAAAAGKPSQPQHTHRSAKSIRIVHCSPDPNAIRVCLSLVYLAEHNNHTTVLPTSIFSNYYSYSSISDTAKDETNKNKTNTKQEQVQQQDSYYYEFNLRPHDVHYVLQELPAKDPLRKGYLAHLATALQGTVQVDDAAVLEDGFHLLERHHNDSSRNDTTKARTENTTITKKNTNNTQNCFTSRIKKKVPRNRTSHLKYCQQQVLMQMEQSQAPLVDVIMTTNTSTNTNTNTTSTVMTPSEDITTTTTTAVTPATPTATAIVNEINENDPTYNGMPDTKAIPVTAIETTTTTSEPTEGGGGKGGPIVVPNIPDPNDRTMMSIRHPRTRMQYLEEKKYPQIQWLLRRLDPIITVWRGQQHPHDEHTSATTTTTPPYIHLLDVGGGRGDIAVAVATQYPDVKVTVVDMNASSLRAGQDYYNRAMNTADRNSTTNTTQNDNTTNRAEFICANFAHYAQNAFRNNCNSNSNSNSNSNNNTTNDMNDNSNDKNQRQQQAEVVVEATEVQIQSKQQRQQPQRRQLFDIVIAWHACGDLSDYALEYSIRTKAQFIINPCCYTKRYMPTTFVPKYILDYCTTSTTTSSNNLSSSSNTTNNINKEEKATFTDIHHNNSNSNKTSKKNGNNVADAATDNANANTNDNNNDNDSATNIETIQRLAETNDRLEISHRAMKLINTMRLRSLQSLLLSLSSSSSSPPSSALLSSSLVLSEEFSTKLSLKVEDDEQPNIGTHTCSIPSTSNTTDKCNNDNGIRGNTLLSSTTTAAAAASSSLPFTITLEAYDVAYSSKNLVLVGTTDSNNNAI